MKMQKAQNIIISLIFLIKLLYCDQNKTILDYRSKYFPSFILNNETLKEVKLGFENNTRILQYIDFRNSKDEKATDIVVAYVDDNGNENIKFYYYNNNIGQFVLDKDSFDLENIELIVKTSFIKNLIITDINHDNIIDMVITYKDKDNILYNSIWIGYHESTEKISFKNPHDIVGSQFMLADVDGDRILDFIYWDKSIRKRKILSFPKSSPDEKRILDFKDITLNSPECMKYEKDYPINEFHSSAFVDINGDCTNDLLIHSKDGDNVYLEFWMGRRVNGEIKYCLLDMKKIDNDFGLFSVEDINNDGQLDIIFPIINSQPPKIFVGYNKRNIEYDWAKNYCETVEEIKYRTYEPIFDNFGKDVATNYTYIFPLSNEKELVFYQSDKSPILIRFGDLNLDSYTDIITVMKNTTDNTRFFRIIMNKPLKVETENKIGTSEFDYSLTHKYIHYTDIEYISFFDLDENGQLDVLAVRRNKNGYKITGFFNIEAYDNFFLKALTTKSRKNFFSNEIGTSYRYFVTDLKGERKLRVASQHPQVSCLNLDLPYSHVGIGPSYNYVENYHVITTSNKNYTDSNLKIYTPIIPNSQLLVYNYNEDTPSDSWELDLIVTPISKILLVVIVILIILAILLVVIIILHFMEKRDDESKDDPQLWL